MIHADISTLYQFVLCHDLFLEYYGFGFLEERVEDKDVVLKEHVLATLVLHDLVELLKREGFVLFGLFQNLTIVVGFVLESLLKGVDG